ncbi:hypothetical protein IQ61_05815 [Streptomyces scabiei]|nr:hypothetical protein IQ61_05815 [Streptomyces scabiei]
MTQPGTDPPQELTALTRRSGPQFARGMETRMPASAARIPATAWPPALALVALSVAMRPMVIVPAPVLDGVACCGRAPPPTCGDRAVS